MRNSSGKAGYGQKYASFLQPSVCNPAYPLLRKLNLVDSFEHGINKKYFAQKYYVTDKTKKILFWNWFLCLFFANSLQGDPNGKRTHEELFI